MRTFIDTNIIIDYFGRREKFYEGSRRIIELGYEREIELLTSSLSITNALYLLRKLVGKEEAKRMLKHLCTYCRITNVGENIINQAFALDWTDFEDSVQFLSAKSANADIIITRNPKDFQQEEVKVMLPEDFLDEYYDELAD